MKVGNRYRVRIFQFTPLHEGRLKQFHKGFRPSNFNSRPCTRGDTDIGDMHLIVDVKFQFTPLHEGRLRPFVAGFFPH